MMKLFIFIFFLALVGCEKRLTANELCDSKIKSAMRSICEIEADFVVEDKKVNGKSEIIVKQYHELCKIHAYELGDFKTSRGYTATCFFDKDENLIEFKKDRINDSFEYRGMAQ